MPARRRVRTTWFVSNPAACTVTFRASLSKLKMSFENTSKCAIVNRDFLIELVRDEPRLWDQRTKAYHNRELKPVLWEDIGNKLHITGKFCLFLYVCLLKIFKIRSIFLH